MPDQKKVGSLRSYLKLLHKALRKIERRNNGKGVVVYRGHADETYTFMPSLFRPGNENIRANESKLLHHIEAARPSDFEDKTTLDKLVTLQHYEFPTRLLDVTSNPFVALYFAALDHQEKDGAVVVCKVPEDMIRDFDSEFVVQLAILAKLSDDEKKNLEKSLFEQSNKKSVGIPPKKEVSKRNMTDEEIANKASGDKGVPEETAERAAPEEDMNNLNADDAKSHSNDAGKKIIERYISLIEAEMLSYTKKPLLEDLRRPVYVKPKQTNPRILAQQGAFLLFGLGENLDGILQETITIDHSAKPGIIRELDTFAGINQGVLFPELDKFLTYTRQCARDGII